MKPEKQQCRAEARPIINETPHQHAKSYFQLTWKPPCALLKKARGTVIILTRTLSVRESLFRSVLFRRFKRQPPCVSLTETHTPALTGLFIREDSPSFFLQSKTIR